MEIEAVQLALVTSAIALGSGYLGMRLQDRFTRRAEGRQAERDAAAEERRIVQEESARERAAELALVQAQIEAILTMDRQAKLELLHLFTRMERKLLADSVLDLLDPDCEAMRRLLAENPTSAAEAYAEMKPHLQVLAHPYQQSVLLSCAELATFWRRIDTFHGDDPFLQLMVAGAAARTAVDLLSAAVRGQGPPPLPRSLLRRLPTDASDSVRFRFREDYLADANDVSRELAEPLHLQLALPAGAA